MAKAQAQAPQAVEQPKAPEAPRAVPKDGELVKLFAEYEAADAAVSKASDAYDKAMGVRSAVVERFASFGKVFTSPTGLPLQVASRLNKGTGARGFYFRGTTEEPIKIK